MSPEQVRAKELDCRTDLFSFGAVLYEMATGAMPFHGESAATIYDGILNRDPVPPTEINREIPAKLEEIIHKALEKDRALRYQHASEMRADLQRLKRDTTSGRIPATTGVAASGSGSAMGLPAATSSGIAVRTPAKLFSSSSLGFGLLVALTLIALGLGWFWFKGKGSAPRKALSEVQITHSLAENSVFGGSISPNGKRVAYIDPKGLHLIAIESGESHDIALPEEYELVSGT